MQPAPERTERLREIAAPIRQPGISALVFLHAAHRQDLNETPTRMGATDYERGGFGPKLGAVSQPLPVLNRFSGFAEDSVDFWFDPEKRKPLLKIRDTLHTGSYYHTPRQQIAVFQSRLSPEITSKGLANLYGPDAAPEPASLSVLMIASLPFSHADHVGRGNTPRIEILGPTSTVTEFARSLAALGRISKAEFLTLVAAIFPPEQFPVINSRIFNPEGWSGEPFREVNWVVFGPKEAPKPVAETQKAPAPPPPAPEPTAPPSAKGTTSGAPKRWPWW